MANSIINFYLTKLSPGRNAWIDEIETFLGLPIETAQAQYIKHDLNLTVKISLTQNYLNDMQFNYVSIKNDNESKVFYYFVLGFKWLSIQTIELNLSLDSINTWFKGGLGIEEQIFTDKTSIVREHLDRYEETPIVGSVYKRKVHPISEGINPVLKKVVDQEIRSNIDKDFYLIYRTKKDITPENISNPVECLLVAESPLLLARGQTLPAQALISESLTQGVYYYFTYNDNPDGVISTVGGPAPIKDINLDSNTRVIVMYKKDYSIQVDYINYIKKGDYYITSQEKGTAFNLCDSVTLYSIKNARTSNTYITAYNDILNMTKKVYDSGVIGDTQTIAFKDIDRTDNRIVKIIKLPYYPTDFSLIDGVLQYDSNIWEYKEGMLKLKDLNTSFKATIGEFIVNAQGSLTYSIGTLTPYSNPNILAESKLYHSDFFVNKLVYDDASYLFKMENITSTVYPNTLDISFKVTNTINSKMLFKVKSLNGFLDTTRYIYKEEQDYEGYLFANRNNEVVIYNSDYVNYIKTGFNYDKKRISQDTTFNWLGTGLQIAGSFLVGSLSLATGNPISGAASVAMASSAIASIANNINQGMANERNLESKLAQLANQKTNMQGADDIDLLKEYNGNRLRQIIYNIKDITLRDNIFKLFYYTGYSSPRYGVPNLSSRVWFNYIQCTPKFTGFILKTVPDVYLNDIKARFEIGVTKFHNYNNEYNLEQSKENLERFLIGGQENV